MQRMATHRAQIACSHGTDVGNRRRLEVPAQKCVSSVEIVTSGANGICNVSSNRFIDDDRHVHANGSDRPRANIEDFRDFVVRGQSPFARLDNLEQFYLVDLVVSSQHNEPRLVVRDIEQRLQDGIGLDGKELCHVNN
jgi:hypothetical protein